MNPLAALNVKIFAHGADVAGLVEWQRNPLVQGITTNVAEMRRAGITDYEAFAKELLQVVKTKPVAFEIFADDLREMRRQAHKICAWQENVQVQIPILNAAGESTLELIRDLAREGVKLNVTAIAGERQLEQVAGALEASVPSVVSIFAGGIADTGRDPMPVMRASHDLLVGLPKAEILWAGVREIYNIFQADEARIHIVTVPQDMLQKAMSICSRDPAELSRATARKAGRDAKAAGLTLTTGSQALAAAVAAAMRRAA